MTDTATILVVDDQADHLSAIEMLLVGFGYRVILCASGTMALQRLEEESIDLILADVAMPQMNGYQLLEAVRRQPRWATVPFIFVTARALDSDVRYGKALGADDYLTKPIQPEDLLAVVEGKLRRREQLAQATALPAAPPPNEIRVGRVRLDPGHHRAWLDDLPLALSVKEFVLLEQLAGQAGVVLPARALVQATHGLVAGDADEARELIRPLVRSLRQKLGASGEGPGLIETVRGLGYRLVED
ncbi:MAG: response regulator transcription factor [Chloroflexales bacterium]|nr:response regulator transcription factor [Chloroflexales bacterium]